VALAGALVAAGWLIHLPGTALAGTEEFSSFDVITQEEDDESLIDHLLARPPRAWRDEWERSRQGIRTSQGCLTSGQWFIDTQLKLGAPLGERARFGLEVREEQSDIVSYQYFDFSFRFPTRWGTPGAMFRPFHDKSRQDFALTWETGADTTALQLQTAFTFEDTFNNLWAFRQTRVGNHAEPYERHPFEPALRFVSRAGPWRADVSGHWLTPSRRRIPVETTGVTERATLWGALVRASVEGEALGTEWEVAGLNRQASSTAWSSDGSSRSSDFRRQWSGEGAVRRRLRALTTEIRWLYQQGDQRIEPTAGVSDLAQIDRVLQIEATYGRSSGWAARVGALHDRITVSQAGLAPFTTYGTRVESRAYVGLTARFGVVSVSAAEGLELDHEPYDVWWVHDKAFLDLQASF